MRFCGKGQHGELERELHAGRPEPRDEFVQAVARRTQPRPSVRLGWRVGIAGALTAALLVAIASVGGTSAVKPAVSLGSLLGNAVSAAKSNGNGGGSSNASSPTKSSGSQSAAADQYKFLVCHHAASGKFQTLEVGSQAVVDAHVANHPGDHPGACGPTG